MTQRRVLYSLLAALLVATAGAAAFAQDDGEDTPPAEGEGEVDVRQRADLSPAQQMAEAERIQQHGTQIGRRVQAMLDEARRDRDIIRVTCLNDKLTQVNANLRTLNDRLENLAEAVQGNDRDRGNHEFTVATVLGQKFNTLEQESNQCIGQDLYETGATRVITTIDPDSPDDDPAEYPDVPDVSVPFIPPPSSPTI